MIDAVIFSFVLGVVVGALVVILIVHAMLERAVNE